MITFIYANLIIYLQMYYISMIMLMTVVFSAGQQDNNISITFTIKLCGYLNLKFNAVLYTIHAVVDMCP